ncbi:hypothetical protein AAY473_015092 [Plecturocebus cupreus]
MRHIPAWWTILRTTPQIPSSFAFCFVLF